MRKYIIIGLFIMVGLFLAACGNDGPITLQDEQGKEIVFENMDKPALVFYFTGNT